MSDELSETLEIAELYLAAVTDVMSRFASAGFAAPLEARRAGRLAARGTVEGMPYAFHGVGCVAELARQEIDFDFGPSGRTDGFDAWRLSRFARFVPRYAHLSEEVLKRALRRAVDEGIVVAPGWLPSPHLLYFARSCPA